jgi:CBS domain-containing protein
MLVKVVMRTPIVTVRPGATLDEARAVMARDGLREVPVADAGGLLLGVVTARDVAGAGASTVPVLAQWDWLATGSHVCAGEVMTRDTWAVAPDAPIDEVAACLAARRRETVPVVDDRRIVGQVTVRQLLAAFVRELAGAGTRGPRRIVARVGCGAGGGAVLAAAVELARRHRAHLTLVHVLRAWPGVEDDPLAREMIVDSAHAALIARLPASVHDTARVITVPGGGGAAIVDVACRDGADLILADPRSATDLAAVAPCAVLAVPPASEARDERR